MTAVLSGNQNNHVLCQFISQLTRLTFFSLLNLQLCERDSVLSPVIKNSTLSAYEETYIYTAKKEKDSVFENVKRLETP